MSTKPASLTVQRNAQGQIYSPVRGKWLFETPEERDLFVLLLGANRKDTQDYSVPGAGGGEAPQTPPPGQTPGPDGPPQTGPEARGFGGPPPGAWGGPPPGFRGGPPGGFGGGRGMRGGRGG